jgi:hypothetical protein
VRDVCQIRLKALKSPRLGRATYVIVAKALDSNGDRVIARSASFKLWEPETRLWAVPKAAQAAADEIALALDADGWRPFARMFAAWWAMLGERPLPGECFEPPDVPPTADQVERRGDESPSQRWFETLPCGEEPIASPMIAPRPVLRGW